MTRVDFYLLQDATGNAKEAAACRLTQKVFGLGHRVFILSLDADQATRLDKLLWTFSPGSFVPHALSNERLDPVPPVVVGTEEPDASLHDVLISLATDVPDWFSRFERVAEIVGGTEDEKLQARARYRFYRDRGYTLHTHSL
jgi:DNA polymerase-3 subunit chi